MAPNPASDADYFRDKARRDLLVLLEGVSKALRAVGPPHYSRLNSDAGPR